MSWFDRRLVREFLDEVGEETFCGAVEELIAAAKDVWTTVAQPMGRMSTTVDRLLRLGVVEEIGLPEEVVDFLGVWAEDELRRELYTHVLKAFLEALYSGGSGALGLATASRFCGLEAEARFLATRKAIDWDRIREEYGPGVADALATFVGAVEDLAVATKRGVETMRVVLPTIRGVMNSYNRPAEEYFGRPLFTEEVYNAAVAAEGALLDLSLMLDYVSSLLG